MAKLKVAIVHDYLNQMGGAERVVGVMRQMFPDAPIYTTIADRKGLLPELVGADIRTTWMQRIPGVLKYHKLLFWLYPLAIRSIKLDGYDVVLSSSSAYAKGAARPEQGLHICYCHTPMRFAWEFDTYMEKMRVPGIVKQLSRLLLGPVKRWDMNNSAKVDHLIANSTIVQRRIRENYGLPSQIIFPPVNIERFAIAEEEPEPYYLVVSRLVSYKRIDLAVEACTKLGERLIVIGDGPDRARLQELAGPTVEFAGRLPDEEVTAYMQRCQALFFPGKEDFGITPLEANACGRPVIAYKDGGALDTIQEGKNGVYFPVQTVRAVMDAVEDFKQITWDSKVVRDCALQFSEQHFMDAIHESIAAAMSSGGTAKETARRRWKPREEHAVREGAAR
ncbi:glycosyltransferase family 4 protein [Paenibacillaceae bacterium]|nr:glycosyltransferase family 4 protein [Paenibacillaceae bacterium]